jgi:glucokinase
MIAAIEVGGTKLQLAVAAPSAPDVLIERIRLKVDRSAGAAGIRDQIEDGINQLTSRHDVQRIGVGFGGPVDSERGRVVTSHQVSGWDDFPLVEWFGQRWALPVALGNDCNVAALAEASLGAGRGLRRVLYMTVGTGIGGGLIVDGRIDGERRPAVAELGHLRPGLEARRPDDTVESHASGLAIERIAAQAIRAPQAWGHSSEDAENLRTVWLNDGRTISAEAIATAAAAGQPLAMRLMHHATEMLGWALAQATSLMAPERIVIGGGVSLIGARFFSAVQSEWRTYVFPPLRDSCDIVPAELGEDVVLHGAILLALRASNTSDRSASHAK